MHGRNSKAPVYIYHEMQDSALCGVHAINNLLQCPIFTAVALAEIASDLDAQEWVLMGGGYQGESTNVDISGNFSIQVLNRAMQNYNNTELVPWFTADVDPLDKEGFIVNRSSHWFAIRKINGNWWNLNSTLEKPEIISSFYLSAFLHGLRSDGYSVFYVNGGKLQTQAENKNYDSGGGNELSHWYLEDDLLGKSSSASVGNVTTAGTGKAPLIPFSGVGHRLKDDNKLPPATAAATGTALHAGQCDEEDMELARAISLSMNTDLGGGGGGEKVTAVVDSKEEMRAKRLAALEKRGL